MTDRVLLCAAELTRLATRVLERHGLFAEDARAAAGILVCADLQGISTHGVSRLPQYCARLDADAIEPRPAISIETPTACLSRVDGSNGLGPLVGRRALDHTIDRAKDAGIAFTAVRESNHFGAAAPYALDATNAGFMLLIGTNASPAMAPWRGRDLIMGNNPLAFAAPRRDGPAFIVDMAMSVAARGKMRRLRDAGEAMPLGWALDADGRPTTDPALGLAGFVQFMGGHKGYALALAVDVLAGVLSGSGFLDTVGDMWTEEGPQRTGHFMLVLDPGQLLGREIYDERMEAFSHRVKASAAIDPGRPVLLPGEPEALSHAARTEEGVPIDRQLLEQLLDSSR